MDDTKKKYVKKNPITSTMNKHQVIAQLHDNNYVQWFFHPYQEQDHTTHSPILMDHTPIALDDE